MTEPKPAADDAPKSPDPAADTPTGEASPAPNATAPWSVTPPPSAPTAGTSPGVPPAGVPAAAGYPGAAYGREAPWRAGPDDTTWAMLAHLSYFAFGIIAPLVIMLTKGKQSGFVRDQAVEALNLHISLAILAVVCVALFVLIVPLIVLAAALLAGAVLSIMGAVAASRGEAYRYRFNIRLVR